jgi:hypothetical protein
MQNVSSIQGVYTQLQAQTIKMLLHLSATGVAAFMNLLAQYETGDTEKRQGESFTCKVTAAATPPAAQRHKELCL